MMIWWSILCNGLGIIRIEIANIEINGNIYGIKIEDETLSTGSGNKPFALDGSEIKQSTNVYNSNIKEETFGKIEILEQKDEMSDSVLLSIKPIDNTVLLEDLPIFIGDEEATVIGRESLTSLEYYLSAKKNGEFHKNIGNTVDIKYYNITSVTTINANEFMSNNILSQYKKGKETAVLRCDISEYYNDDIDGTLAISTKDTSKKMTFGINDEVIPMRFNYDGKDVPMSTKTNGNPKSFRVVGSNIIYDGAIWQEISLQEI